MVGAIVGYLDLGAHSVAACDASVAGIEGRAVNPFAFGAFVETLA